MLRSIVHVYYVEVTHYKYTFSASSVLEGIVGLFVFFSFFWLLVDLHWGPWAFPSCGTQA